MRDDVAAVIVLLLVLAAFAVAGTVDHDEDVRHAAWLAGRWDARTEVAL